MNALMCAISMLVLVIVRLVRPIDCWVSIEGLATRADTVVASFPSLVDSSTVQESKSSKKNKKKRAKKQERRSQEQSDSTAGKGGWIMYTD